MGPWKLGQRTAARIREWALARSNKIQNADEENYVSPMVSPSVGLYFEGMAAYALRSAAEGDALNSVVSE